MRSVWKYSLYRKLRRRSAGGQKASAKTDILLAVAAAVFLAGVTIVYSGIKLRPAAAEIARTQAENTVYKVVEEAVFSDLRERGLSYRDFVEIQRGSSGEITALSTDMAVLNALRARLVECVLLHLEDVDVSLISIPVGSLLDIDFLWAKGPDIRLHTMTVGSVSAEFKSEFTSAGVNQTLHRIWLDISVPLTLILPGDEVKVEVRHELCVAETVIVGDVPQTYLQRDLTKG